MKRITESILMLIALIALLNVAACLDPLEDDSRFDRRPSRTDPEFANPTLVYEPPLVYPEAAVAEGWEGIASVRIGILADGTVSSCSLMMSTGYEILDQSALGAASLCLFEPRIYNGEPVPSYTIRVFVFELDASP